MRWGGGKSTNILPQGGIYTFYLYLNWLRQGMSFLHLSVKKVVAGNVQLLYFETCLITSDFFPVRVFPWKDPTRVDPQSVFSANTLEQVQIQFWTCSTNRTRMSTTIKFLYFHLNGWARIGSIRSFTYLKVSIPHYQDSPLEVQIVTSAIFK